MSADRDPIILVDADDRETGVAEKQAAHVAGLRHRAISVLIVDCVGRMLLQRRHPDKYHSGGLWTNACCSHPRPGEDTATAAARRLREEMGISPPLAPMFVAAYRARVGDLIEDEIVHVFGGRYDGEVPFDHAEADAIEWVAVADLAADMAARPERYTVWFLKYMREHHASVEALATGATG